MHWSHALDAFDALDALAALDALDALDALCVSHALDECIRRVGRIGNI